MKWSILRFLPCLITLQTNATANDSTPISSIEKAAVVSKEIDFLSCQISNDANFSVFSFLNLLKEKKDSNYVFEFGDIECNETATLLFSNTTEIQNNITELRAVFYLQKTKLFLDCYFELHLDGKISIKNICLLNPPTERKILTCDSPIVYIPNQVVYLVKREQELNLSVGKYKLHAESAQETIKIPTLNAPIYSIPSDYRIIFELKTTKQESIEIIGVLPSNVQQSLLLDTLLDGEKPTVITQNETGGDEWSAQIEFKFSVGKDFSNKQ